MKDISCEILRARQEGTLQTLIEKYNADPTLDYSVSDKELIIIPSAFYITKGGKNSLEYISKHSKNLRRKDCLAIEIAGTALFDEGLLKFLKFIQGEVGDENDCAWDDGDLLIKSYQEAESLGVKVSLGHTHPVFGTYNNVDRIYGGIPSWVPYTDEREVQNGVKDKRIAKAIINSEIYKRHRGDFIETITRARIIPQISYFSWILSPALDQLGIFEVKDGGKVIYHPWIVRD